ncbi:acyltransferase [Actinoplanes sp. LDG1-06]|uniref:Acyltransferase n=1 Tax=Paractinoplanes ovalisporus TaxID=2810368 RepID=A0ABS2AK15_9ACTN|nr:acyltransferase [Actinoplanes ovalisporus]MBM2620192.1 acyltransferase [Actinoplanes ovalisporus]
MRNRYLDLLRAAAIVRVIVYHLFGWPWLSIVLPAMGVMFALAGSLTAASLSKRDAGKVITSRLRRLLPPLWLLGLIAVPVMLVAGWARESDGDHPFSLPGLLFWIFPIGDPPGSDQAIDVWEPLWYIRAYVWFVLLSPALFALWKRIGWATVALPLLMLAALDLTGFELPETADAALWDFVTYGACWVAGFAHHDGRLQRLKPWLAYPVALVMAAAALYWAHGEGSWDLNDISESQALWSLAFVLIVLRWQPAMGWLERVKPLDKAVTVVNARAVTIYLWHNIAIAAVWPVLTVLALDDLGDRLGAVTDLVAAFVLTLLAMLAFGWAEDLGARRRLRIWPDTRPPHAAPEPQEQPEFPVTAAHHRSSAAAAMTRAPANWPPTPRDDPGLPIAGRRAEPLEDGDRPER